MNRKSVSITGQLAAELSKDQEEEASHLEISGHSEHQCLTSLCWSSEQLKSASLVRKSTQFGVAPGPCSSGALGFTELVQHVSPASQGPPCWPGVLSLETACHQPVTTLPLQAGRNRVPILAFWGTHNTQLLEQTPEPAGSPSKMGKGCTPGSKPSPHKV